MPPAPRLQEPYRGRPLQADCMRPRTHVAHRHNPLSPPARLGQRRPFGRQSCSGQPSDTSAHPSERDLRRGRFATTPALAASPAPAPRHLFVKAPTWRRGMPHKHDSSQRPDAKPARSARRSFRICPVRDPKQLVSVRAKDLVDRLHASAPIVPPTWLDRRDESTRRLAGRVHAHFAVQVAAALPRPRLPR